MIELVAGRDRSDERAVLWPRWGVLLSCIGYASQLCRQKLEINTEALRHIVAVDTWVPDSRSLSPERRGEEVDRAERCL